MGDFFWGVITGVLIILAAFLIPAILQFKKTAKAAEDFYRNTQASLNPLLEKIHAAVDKTDKIAGRLDESISNVQQLTKAAGEAGAIISDINNSIRKIQTACSVTTLCLGAGIKTALGVLTHGILHQFTSKKEDNDKSA